jgi:hypothetical protein
VIIGAVSLRFHSSRLKRLVCAFLIAPLICLAAEDAALQKIADSNRSAGSFDASSAERFAKLALQCVHKEYPNKISHVLNSEADVAAPCKLTPRLRLLDWHSSCTRTLAAGAAIAHVSDASFAKAARRFEGKPG